MGRKAEGHAVWRGASGAVRACLERDGITLRGDVKAKLPRNSLTDWRADGGDLCLTADGGALVLTLGAKEVAAWVKALEKPLPSLATKLEVADAARAWVIGGPAPEELAVALAGVAARRPEDAALIVAVLSGPGDLEDALAQGQATVLRVWCVHGKGKGAAVGDSAVRAAFRGAGWVDIKTSAVSDAFTALLFRPPTG